jgi:hypothetical protein
MNRLTIAVLTALALPATASAARLEPLPFDRASALCLSATGVPGGLSQLGPYTRRQSATDLLTAGGDGVARSARVEIGRMARCASAAEAPGGAAIVAGTTVNRDYAAELRAVVRDPGGAFGEPAVLSDQGIDAVAAVGPAGHAVVAWSEVRGRRHRILAARRAPGGTFGAPETLVEARTDQEAPEVELAATVDAAGDTTLLWSRELPSDDFDEHVEAAVAAPGATFGVQRLGDGVSTSGPPSLAGAADGWAVAAFAASGLQVFERAPGGTLQPVTMPALAGRNATRNDVSAAVRDGGGAVLAWRVHGSRGVSGVEAMTRTAGGGAWSLHRVAPEGPPVSSGSSEGDFVIEPFVNPFDFLTGPPVDDRDRELEVAVAGGGDIVIAWRGGAGRAPLRVETAHAVLGRLDGTFEPAQRLGSTLRRTFDVAPLVLVDGRAAVAWTDAASELRHGRLHLAVESAPPQAPAAAPRLTLRAPRRQRLYAQQPPRVIARCDVACDLRTIVLGPRGDRSEALAGTRLRGRGRLDLDTVFRPGTVKVVVHATAPGGDAITVRSLRLRVERRPALPLQRPLDVTARRRGREIVVRWRTAEPARRQTFIVAGQDRRDEIVPGAPGTLDVVPANGRRRFAVRLREPASVRVRWVVVLAASLDSGAERHVLVKVRR